MSLAYNCIPASSPNSSRCHGKGVFNAEARSKPNSGTEAPGAVGVKGMGELVSFRKARKQVARERGQKRAAENRVRYGRSKHERSLDAARAAKADRDHQQHHRVESGDDR